MSIVVHVCESLMRTTARVVFCGRLRAPSVRTLTRATDNIWWTRYGGGRSQFDFVTNDNCRIPKLWLNVSWDRKNRHDFDRAAQRRVASRRRDCSVLCAEWNHDYTRTGALCDRHRYSVTRIIKNVSALCYRRDRKKNRERETDARSWC